MAVYACRPVDWQPLAEADPVPGDPTAVAELARRLRATAEAISRQATALRGLCTDEYWDSDGGRQFREAATDLAGKLDKVERRYHETAGALSAYGPQLDHAQSRSLTARAQAREAEEEHRRKVAAVAAAAASRPAGPAVPGEAAPGVPRVDPSDDSYLDQARATLADAVKIRDDAAKAAAHAISQAMHDGLNDSRWDRLKNKVHNFVQRHVAGLNKLSAAAGWVAAVCGTLSLVVVWIPVVGVFLAGALETVALTASYVSLVCDATLMMGGKASLVSVGIDTLGVATFGIGRAGLAGAERSAKAARGAVRNAGVRKLMAQAEAEGRRLRPGPSLNKVYNKAKLISGGLNGATAREAIADASGSAFTRSRRFLRDGVFHPGALLVEGAEDIVEGRALRGLRNGTLAAAEREFSRLPHQLPPAVRIAGKDMNQALKELHLAFGETDATAERFARQFRHGVRTYWAASGTGVVVAWTDRFGFFNGLKQEANW